MADLAFAEAFAKYGAKLHNVQWSVCAVAPDGSLVVSLWRHHFHEKAKDGALICRDSFLRWSGPGNAEFREKIANAFKTKQVIRLVIADTAQTKDVESGADASTLKKTFNVREDLIGEVIEASDDNYAISFKKRG
jgi:hypothetical protein